MIFWWTDILSMPHASPTLAARDHSVMRHSTIRLPFIYLVLEIDLVWLPAENDDCYSNLCPTVAATVGKVPELLSKLVTFLASPATAAIIAHRPKSDKSSNGTS